MDGSLSRWGFKLVSMQAFISFGLFNVLQEIMQTYHYEDVNLKPGKREVDKRVK